jgi:hypothetical protein
VDGHKIESEGLGCVFSQVVVKASTMLEVAPGHYNAEVVDFLTRVWLELAGGEYGSEISVGRVHEFVIIGLSASLFVVCFVCLTTYQPNNI